MCTVYNPTCISEFAQYNQTGRAYNSLKGRPQFVDGRDHGRAVVHKHGLNKVSKCMVLTLLENVHQVQKVAVVDDKGRNQAGLMFAR